MCVPPQSIGSTGSVRLACVCQPKKINKRAVTEAKAFGSINILIRIIQNGPKNVNAWFLSDRKKSELLDRGGEEWEGGGHCVFMESIASSTD